MYLYDVCKRRYQPQRLKQMTTKKSLFIVYRAHNKQKHCVEVEYDWVWKTEHQTPKMKYFQSASMQFSKKKFAFIALLTLLLMD